MRNIYQTLCHQHAHCTACRAPGSSGDRFRAAVCRAADIRAIICPLGIAIGGETPPRKIVKKQPCIYRGDRIGQVTLSGCGCQVWLLECMAPGRDYQARESECGPGCAGYSPPKK